MKVHFQAKFAKYIKKLALETFLGKIYLVHIFRQHLLS